MPDITPCQSLEADHNSHETTRSADLSQATSMKTGDRRTSTDSPFRGLEASTQRRAELD